MTYSTVIRCHLASLVLKQLPFKLSPWRRVKDHYSLKFKTVSVIVGNEYHGRLTFGKREETVEIWGNDIDHVDGKDNEGSNGLFSSDSDDDSDWKETKKSGSKHDTDDLLPLSVMVEKERTGAGIDLHRITRSGNTFKKKQR